MSATDTDILPEVKTDSLEALVVPVLQADLTDLAELGRYTLADAIREGCGVTSKATGSFTDGVSTACAFSAAHVAAKARGIL